MAHPNARSGPAGRVSPSIVPEMSCVNNKGITCFDVRYAVWTRKFRVIGGILMIWTKASRSGGASKSGGAR